MTFITDQIAIGNSQDAVAPVGVTAILNTAFDLDVAGSGHPVYERHKVGLCDGPGNPPLQMLAAVMCLSALLDKKHKVLVHCHEGKSRSPVVVAVYQALRGGADLLPDIIEEMRQKRPEIDPNPELLLLGAKTIGACNQLFPAV